MWYIDGYPSRQAVYMLSCYTGGTGGPGGVGGSNGQLAIFSSAANLQQLGVTPVALYGDVGLGGAGGLGGKLTHAGVKMHCT